VQLEEQEFVLKQVVYIRNKSHRVIIKRLSSASRDAFYASMFKDYLREFLQPSNRQPPSLGDATRTSCPPQTKKVDAALFIYHLLGYSPNSRILEQELLMELRTISNLANAIGKGLVLYIADAQTQSILSSSRRTIQSTRGVAR